MKSESGQRSRVWRTGLAGAVLLAATATVSMRILDRLCTEHDPGDLGCALMDFRDVVYYPVVAFLHGENPYDRETFARTYPVIGGIGFYSPVTLAVHLPFGLLRLEAAEQVYYVLSVALTIMLGALALSLCGLRPTACRVFGVGAFLLMSWPGKWNLFIGQVTLQVIIATYLAIWCARTRPLVSALGFAVAALKPTYALPLALLMLARGDRRALGIGVVLAAGLAAAVMIPVVITMGVPPVLSSPAGTGYREAFLEGLSRWPHRVDVVSLVERMLGRLTGGIALLTIGLAVLGFAAAGLRRLAARTERDARVLSLSLASIAILTSTYHQQYDLLALTVPLLSLLWSQGTVWDRYPKLRLTALTLATLPFVNYAVSNPAIEALHLRPTGILVANSVDNVALVGLLAIFGLVALKTNFGRSAQRATTRGADTGAH